MLLSLVLLGSTMGLGVSKAISLRRKRKFNKLYQRKLPSTKLGVSRKPVDIQQLAADIRNVLVLNERQDLQADIDPELCQKLDKVHKENRQRIWLSFSAFGLALLGGIYPVFSVITAGAIIYLSRRVFRRCWKDYKQGHYLSVYLINIISIFGMLVSGQLILATFASLFGGFFASMIDRIETNSQKQLVSAFNIHPETVWVLKDGVEIELDFDAVKIDDIVVVNAGETIPVDGSIDFGTAHIDQHVLTGESQPVEKSVGDPVFSSTVILSGRIGIKVSTSGEATVVARIGEALNQTRDYKDTLRTRGRKIADDLVPSMLLLTAATYIVRGLRAATTISWSSPGRSMVALGPLSLLSYLQILARNGILIKDGRIFESLHQVDTIVFDKTGTLTLEQPTVGQINCFNAFSKAEVLRYAATAEYRQPHPIAKAIIARARAEKIDPATPDDANYSIGHGIEIYLDDRIIRVGSARFLGNEGVDLPERVRKLQEQADEHGYSLVYVSVDQQLAGVLEMQPTIRPEARDIVRFLKQRDIEMHIISGDHEGATRNMAQTLGIDHYFAEVLPENKATRVKQLREQGKFVCFIGDGINDAIALKSAQVSVSLKGASSAATDTAQVIFMDGSLEQLPQLFKLTDEFEKNMKVSKSLSIAPGVAVIAGVYLFSLSTATGMIIFYLSLLAGLGNTIRPLLAHQNKGRLDNDLEI